MQVVEWAGLLPPRGGYSRWIGGWPFCTGGTRHHLDSEAQSRSRCVKFDVGLQRRHQFRIILNFLDSRLKQILE